jgi:hypothetical protein
VVAVADRAESGYRTMRHRSSGSRARGTRLSPPADGAHSAQQLWRASVSARVTAFSSPHDTAWTDRPPQSSTCGDVYSRPESVFSRQARAGIDTEQDSTLLRLPRVPGAPGVPRAPQPPVREPGRRSWHVLLFHPCARLREHSPSGTAVPPPVRLILISSVHDPTSV